MLLSICQLISEGMLLTTEDGEVKLASFFKEEEFNRLFEKFILEYYKAEFPHLKASASQIDWAVDDGITTMLPVMQTDVTLSHNDRTLIIDAKYYARSTQYYRDTHKLHSMNLYQIFTYVKNKAQEFEEGTHEVSGLLLYAKTEENYLEDTTFQMSGNKIAVRTLDLSVDFRDVSNQLNAIPQENL